MTELRRRMDGDMVVRGMADRTRETYLRAVTGLARYYHRSTDQISDDAVQAYLLYLIRDRQPSCWPRGACESSTSVTWRRGGAIRARAAASR